MAQIIYTSGEIIEVGDEERSEQDLENFFGEYVVQWHPTKDDMIMIVSWAAYDDEKPINKVASEIMGRNIWGDVLYGPSRISYDG